MTSLHSKAGLSYLIPRYLPVQTLCPLSKKLLGLPFGRWGEDGHYVLQSFADLSSKSVRVLECRNQASALQSGDITAGRMTKPQQETKRKRLQDVESQARAASFWVQMKWTNQSLSSLNKTVLSWKLDRHWEQSISQYLSSNSVFLSFFFFFHLRSMNYERIPAIYHLHAKCLRSLNASVLSPSRLYLRNCRPRLSWLTLWAELRWSSNGLIAWECMVVFQCYSPYTNISCVDLMFFLSWMLQNTSIMAGLMWAIILTHKYWNVFLLTVWLQECLEDTWKLIMSSPVMMYETP